MSEEKEVINTTEINPAAQDGISNDQTEKTDSASFQNDGGKEDNEGRKDGQEEEYMDILGNGTLMKRVVEQGSGNNMMMGERVTIELQRTIPEMEKEFPSEEVTFTVGDCDVEQALDLAVALMKLREKAIVISGYKYMFGEIGLEPDIPPRANFKLDVHVIANHGFPDYNKMELEERFSEAKKKKERGNFYFRRKEYSQAVYVYSKANKIVDPDEGCVYPDAAPEKLQELLEFRGVTLANTSVAQLKVGAPDAAIKSALEATKLCPAYSKAYFRLGQAYEGKGNIDEAIKAHKLALKNDPENSKEVEYNQIIHNELSRLTKLNKEAKQSQQEMYSKMFWGAKPPNVTSSQKAKVKDDSSLSAPPPKQQHRPASPTPTTGASTDSAFVFNNPMFEAGIKAGKQSLAEGRSFQDTLAIASSFLQKMSSGEICSPEEIMRMAGQMSAVIPPEIDAVLRKSFEERMKSLTEKELSKAQSEMFTFMPHDLQKLLAGEAAGSTDGMNDQLAGPTAKVPESKYDGLSRQHSDLPKAVQEELSLLEGEAAGPTDGINDQLACSTANVPESKDDGLSRQHSDMRPAAQHSDLHTAVQEELSLLEGEAAVPESKDDGLSRQHSDLPKAVQEELSLLEGEAAGPTDGMNDQLACSTANVPESKDDGLSRQYSDLRIAAQEELSLLEGETAGSTDGMNDQLPCSTAKVPESKDDGLSRQHSDMRPAAQHSDLHTALQEELSLLKGEAAVPTDGKNDQLACSTANVPESKDDDGLSRQHSDLRPAVQEELSLLDGEAAGSTNGMNDQLAGPTAKVPESKDDDGLSRQHSDLHTAVQEELSLLEGEGAGPTDGMNDHLACSTANVPESKDDGLSGQHSDLRPAVQEEFSLLEGEAAGSTNGMNDQLACSTENVPESKDDDGLSRQYSDLRTAVQEEIAAHSGATLQPSWFDGQPSALSSHDDEAAFEDGYLVTCTEALRERRNQTLDTIVDQQAGLAAPATGDYNLIEERRSNQSRGNAFVEMNQVYAKMNYFSWSTDVDTGDTCPEDIIEVNATPAQDIVELHDEQKKYSWLTNPMLLGTIGVGLAGVGMGLYRYFNSH